MGNSGTSRCCPRFSSSAMRPASSVFRRWFRAAESVHHARSGAGGAVIGIGGVSVRRPQGRRRWAPNRRLPAEAETGEQAVVPVNIGVAEVPQLAATLTHEHQQPAARVEVMAVLPQMVCEQLDAIREERNLHLW